LEADSEARERTMAGTTGVITELETVAKTDEEEEDEGDRQ